MYLGLDLGTSGLKGVLVDNRGKIRAAHNQSLEVYRPHKGWSEQAPQDWILAAQTVLSNLGDLTEVRAIGLSGQMHGATCLDKDGKVIRPCILWNDTRAHREAAKLDARKDFRETTGNIVFPGFTAPKILWMQENEPQNHEQIKKVLLPKDYLRFWLTGELVSDMSDASGTSWLDVGKRSWSKTLLGACGLDEQTMPRLVEGSEISAKVASHIAKSLGMNSDVVVAGGAGDNAATAMGLDIISPGSAFLSLGTSGVVFAVNDAFQPNPASALHTFCHAIPKTWHQMGVTLSATDSLNWLARQLGASPIDLVGALGPLGAPSAEIFLPFLAGERTPYNSAAISAEFRNIRHQTDRAALTRAVLEGVSFSLKQNLDLIEETSGAVSRILAVGGGAQSDYWLTQLATILGRPLLRPANAENAAALGAARLGAMALGEDLEVDREGQIFEGKTEFASAYQEKFESYVEIAEAQL